MYKTILVTLDMSPTDRVILEHVKKLAAALGSSVVLLHVATGVPAIIHGTNAAGEEIDSDSAGLRRAAAEFEAAGIVARAQLAYGEPVAEIIRWVKENNCDLIAMGTHGHQLIGDLIYGQTAIRVQHHVSVPVLLLRGK